MSWFYLFLASIFEIGWPLGFKLSQLTESIHLRVTWIVVAVISMSLSGIFLWLAQKFIPIGTAYAIWTGIGAAGTFVIGLFFFKDPANLMRIASVFLIIAGVIGLKLSQ